MVSQIHVLHARDWFLGSRPHAHAVIIEMASFVYLYSYMAL